MKAKCPRSMWRGWIGKPDADIFGWQVLIASSARSRSQGDSAEDQIKRLAKVSADGNRFLLGRVPIQLDVGGASVLVSTHEESRFAARLECDLFGSELLEALREDKLFMRFISRVGEEAEKKNIPGKDNGLDIEGLAVAGENRLFVGLRGPVLRGWATTSWPCCTMAKI
jgi:hypothetical protein